VKQTVQDLITQGVRPTRDRVREALGGGRFETLSPLLRRAKDELGIMTPQPDEEDDETTPALDQTRVQALIEDEQGEAAVEDLLYDSAHAVAHLDRFLEQLPQAQAWYHGVSGTWAMNDIDTHVLREAAWELRRVVLRHGRAYDALHGQGDQTDGSRPTAAD